MLVKSLKTYTLTGVFFVSILGVLLHFAYNWLGNNPIIGLFVPVNESTWEHMKLLFFPMLIYSFFSQGRISEENPCIRSATLLGTLIGTVSIPIFFYTYSGVLGFNLHIIDISSFFICVLIAFFITSKAAKSCSMEPYIKYLTTLTIIFAAAFIIFTIFPPEIALFANPN